jgi:RNA polymerase sigma factor for flagellar operon FliA
MSAFDGQYPRDLGKVVAHAKRLSKVLKKMERSRGDAWFVGRSVEVRGVVSLALADWRSGANDTEKTGQAIVSYLDTIHRGACKKLQSGLALDCCEGDDVITSLGGDEARSAADLDAANDAPTPAITNAPTVQTGWVDSAEMLERFQGGLGLLEMNARAVMRRVGEAGATMDDLRGFGREGLLDAARTFDERRGVPFDGWASLRIRNAMIDGVRRWGPVPARARRRTRDGDGTHAAVCARDGGPGLSASTDAAIEASVGASPTDMAVHVGHEIAERLEGLGPSPEEALDGAQLTSLLREIVGKLPERQRELVERSYFDGEKVEEAAALMGVSRSWAYRVHTDAIETIRRELRKRESRPVSVGGKARGSR